MIPMKIQFLLYLIWFIPSVSFSQNVGINTNTPDASAALDITSTSKGLLPPRMTKTERDLIESPATGLIIFQTDNSSGFYYNAGTTDSVNWLQFGIQTTSSVYGDGTGGNLTVTGNLDWTALTSDFNLQFSNIEIAPYAILTVPSGTKLRCTGKVNIQGVIIVKGAEKSVGEVPNGWISGIARTLPGLGSQISYGIKSTAVSSLFNIPVFGGSSGANGDAGNLGYGGEGGGSFAIYANGAITVGDLGEINSDGGSALTGTNIVNGPTSGSGGGGGGVIVLLSKTSISNTGYISAKGGNGSDGTQVNARPGGGGGGGGIALLAAPTISEGTVNVNGGIAGNNLITFTFDTAKGGAGGACGGNGGVGGSVSFVNNVKSAVYPSFGAVGIKRLFISNNPENLY